MEKLFQKLNWKTKLENGSNNWTQLAVNDLKSIAEYISKDSVQYAKLQIARIKLRTRILNSQTYSGKIVAEINKNNIRELIEGNYRKLSTKSFQKNGSIY